MLTQHYSDYSPTDHHTWGTLYARQLESVQQVAYANFFPSLLALGFTSNRIPDFNNINQRLRALTGWSVYAVPGLIDNRFFFEQMHDRKFGATTWIRKPEQLDYLEEPDMFHDVFGHLPLLADPLIADYLHGLARVALKHIDDGAAIEAIARLYWYTIEFGLVKEADKLRIYGAGILSSIGETAYCLSEKPRLVPFNVAAIINTPYIKDAYQEQYFVLNAIEELPKAITVLDDLLQT